MPKKANPSNADDLGQFNDDPTLLYSLSTEEAKQWHELAEANPDYPLAGTIRANLNLLAKDEDIT